jgi:hypothetical protein
MILDYNNYKLSFIIGDIRNYMDVKESMNERVIDLVPYGLNLTPILLLLPTANLRLPT